MSLNIDETYAGGGDFIKAADLQGRRANVTIKGARLEDLQDGKKIVLDFVETPKRLVLNKTNANMICDLLKNRDAEQWFGSTISLRPDKTQLQDGRTVDCIRVDFELPPQTNSNGLGARVVAANPAFGQNAAQVAQPLAPNLSQPAPATIPANDAQIPF